MLIYWQSEASHVRNQWFVAASVAAAAACMRWSTTFNVSWTHCGAYNMLFLGAIYVFFVFISHYFSPISVWCCRDGRLKENDQILAINDRVLSSGVSHQQAIHILQSASGVVRLLVARSLTSTLPASSSTSHDEHRDSSSVTQQVSPADQTADMVVSLMPELCDSCSSRTSTL